MKEVLVTKDDTKGIRTEIVDSPIPVPGENQVLIKVIVSGTNPKDWKVPIWVPQLVRHNSGDDIAGYIHSIGPKVTEFHVGDRVAAFHEMMKPHGSFAEYAVAWAHTTFHIPEETGFEEAATLPLAAMTACVGLYARLGLPEPWAKVHPARAAAAGGVIVYGAASAVGGFTIKLLVRADVHPIIAVAGNGIQFVEGLIDKAKGDVIIDYREGDEKVVEGLKAATPKSKRLMYAFDAVSEHNSYQNIVQALDPHGHVTLVLPGKQYDGIPETVNQSTTMVGNVHGQRDDDLSDLGFAWFRLFGQGLKQGWFSGHPYEIVPGGLAGVDTGLRNLMEGKASAVKYVYRIADTPGIEQSESNVVR